MAFSNCISLMEIKLPKRLTSIGDSAFEGCERLTNIKLTKNITSIGSRAFNLCTDLSEIIVDENNPVFRSLDGVLFDKAMVTLLCFPQGKKKRYSIPDGIIAIGSEPFVMCKLTRISFPQSLLFIGTCAFYRNQLREIAVNELNPNYCSIDGVLFDKGKRKLIRYPKYKDKTDYAVPDGTIEIADMAFYGCKRLVNIVLPESLELIGFYAFAECKRLKAINLPMNLKYIGQYTFEDCPNLETVTLSRKTRIGHKAFEGFKGRMVYRD